MSKKFSTLTLTILLCFSLVACKSETSKAKTSQGLTYEIYDTGGKKITQDLTKTPTKVTVIGQSIAEMMAYFDLENRIQSISYLEDQTITNKKLKDIPVLAKLWPTKEVLIAQDTDLIYSLTTAFDDDRIGSIDEWNTQGVPVVTTSNYAIGKSIPNYLDEIRLMGKLFQIENKTNKFIETQEKREQKIKEQSKALNTQPSVLLIATDGRGHYYYYPRNFSLVDEMVEGSGGKYLELSDTYLEISLEAVIKDNPDYILFTAFQSDNQEDYLKSLLNNQNLQNVTAIKNKALLEIDYIQATRGDMNYMDLYEKIGHFIQPDLKIEASK
ncbi:ABC transporter substrate-binding protein [Vagococcus silagei]|uniref:Fe/B12 periplasmic-binding domain-containing protein n=1 Tax=Vagococcus silagei TaxID=2508885 RepID=A0A4S3B4G6_9ENTE|nr:ABC transporter substrate-binding protein [Vagococcus silagei]THB62044.1 hypothetical protein ESZ54_02220 [Vagococcus silagei]